MGEDFQALYACPRCIRGRLRFSVPLLVATAESRLTTATDRRGRLWGSTIRQEGRGIGLPGKMRAYNPQDEGHDTVDANLILGHGEDERSYALASCILEDLGVTRTPDHKQSGQNLRPRGGRHQGQRPSGPALHRALGEFTLPNDQGRTHEPHHAAPYLTGPTA